MATRAIVVGGSLAGLCAGRVLGRFFDRVTVIDRDSYPAAAADRTGVPQGRHVHALLARGRRELERLFPGFDPAMRQRGALEIDFGWEVAALRQFGWLPREPSGITSLFASRAMLETVVRDRLRTLPTVELIEDTAVIDVVWSGVDGGRRATGVRLRSAVAGTGRELAADLVVDASGRQSRAPEWLRAAGVEPPAETVVDSLCGYSTRWFKAPEPERWPSEWWWKGIWIDPLLPAQRTAGVLFPVEGGRWIVTLAGIGGHYPPGDEPGFTAALGTLRSPLLAEAVRLAKPISPVYGNRAMANRFRHYERSAEHPAGFLAVGDSVCAFNPIYGQGMTSAAVCARILEDSLERLGPTARELPRRFFRAQARFLRDPWTLATGADLHIPETQGARPALLNVVARYMDALFATAQTDAEVRRHIHAVMNMLAPVSAFFSPEILGRVASGTLRRWAAVAELTAPPLPPPVPDTVAAG